jgi:hypothetical protein
MTMTSTAPVPTRHRVRASVLLPAVGLIAAAAAQIDAAIITNAYRSESPAPRDSLNFPWYGGLAGEISTWWSFAGLFVVIGFGALARSQTLRASKAGRIGAWLAVLGAGSLVVANFLSAANADAMMHDGIGDAIGSMFGGGTALLGIGLTIAGVAVLRSGSWHGVARVIPLANGIWSLAMIALVFGDLLQVSIGIMAALQVALGATLISEEA